MSAYSAESGHPVHTNLDTQSTANRSPSSERSDAGVLSFYLLSSWFVNVSFFFRNDSPLSAI